MAHRPLESLNVAGAADVANRENFDGGNVFLPAVANFLGGQGTGNVGDTVRDRELPNRWHKVGRHQKLRPSTDRGSRGLGGAEGARTNPVVGMLLPQLPNYSGEVGCGAGNFDMVQSGGDRELG